MDTIELQNKIFTEFKEQYPIELTIKELNEVIKDYIKKCKTNHVTTWGFIETYLDKF